MEEDKQTQRLEMKDGEALPLCPSFNSYSSGNFAEIAAKVTEGLCAEEAPPSETSNDLDDDFEFALLRSDGDVTAAETSFDGQFGQVFPIFNRDLLMQDDWNQRDDNKPDLSSARLTLKKLFTETREEVNPSSSSSSSSDVDELEAVPPGTYCVWRPNVVQSSPSRCKKSNSTGSESKGWKFLDLLRRSNSEGTDSFVFLTPKNREQKAEKIKRVDNSKERRNSGDGVKEAGKLKAKRVTNGGEGSPSAHELFYVRNRASKEGDKRKSFLPYRQGVVGFFVNVNSIGKAFPPF